MKLRSFRMRLRVVPLTILAAALMIGIKIGEVLDTASAVLGVPAAHAAADAKPQAVKATGAPKPLTPPLPKSAAAGPTAAPAPVAAVPSPAPATNGDQAPQGDANNSVMPPPPAPEAPTVPPPPAPPKRDPSTFTKAEIDLLQNLAARRDELDKRAKDIEMRENLLNATAKKVDDKIAELKQIESKIQALIKEHDTQDEQSLKSLVKVYENMKPKDAARIFEKLDMPVLLQVVERMKEQKLAAVLADMDPAKAKAITIELATKRQLPNKAASSNG
jgi:flagellar motility protein MotE (MotC chaperone)